MVIENTDPSLTNRDDRQKEKNSFKLSSIKRLKDPTLTKRNLSNKKIYRMASKTKVAGKNSKLDNLSENAVESENDDLHERSLYTESREISELMDIPEEERLDVDAREELSVETVKKLSSNHSSNTSSKSRTMPKRKPWV